MHRRCVRSRPRGAGAGGRGRDPGGGGRAAPQRSCGRRLSEPCRCLPRPLPSRPAESEGWKPAGRRGRVRRAGPASRPVDSEPAVGRVSRRVAPRKRAGWRGTPSSSPRRFAGPGTLGGGFRRGFVGSCHRGVAVLPLLSCSVGGCLPLERVMAQTSGSKYVCKQRRRKSYLNVFEIIESYLSISLVYSQIKKIK